MLAQSALFLAAAVLAVPLFQRLGLGTVLGYLAAGAAIGPTGLGLIQDVEQTFQIAEFGVVLLLFLIGLELEPARIWHMRATIFGSGAAQLALTTLTLGGIGRLLGLSPAAALIAGLGLSLSSTAFVLQLLGEKNELATTHGRAAFGMLLFQDLAALPMLALIPLAAHRHVEGGRPLPERVALTLAALLLLVVAGRWLLRPLFRVVAGTRSHELSTATALLVVVATALLMRAVGLSAALGAFIAGVLLAHSEYRHELEANIEPFKGLLLGLFFMAVGMSANLRLAIDRPVLVAALVAGLVLIKATIVFGIALVRGRDRPTCVSIAVALSQGGEFAFVIFGLAATQGLLAPDLAQMLVVVVTGSMLTTPLLFLLRDRWLDRRSSGGEGRAFDRIEEERPVIVAGFGRFGQIVSRVLRVRRIPFTALEVSPAQVDFVRRYGNKIYFGDASRVDLLRAAGAAKARAFVLAIDDPEASMRTARAVRENFPDLPIVARARNRDHALALFALGIETVVRETYASSLEAAERTLERLGFSPADAREAVRRFRQHDEELLEQQFGLRGNPEELVASARRAAEQLEVLFEQDEEAS